MSLWGEAFELDTKSKTNKIIDKIKKPKAKATSTEKQLQYKFLSYDDRIAIIREKVYSVLGNKIHNIEVIKTKQQLKEYVDKVISIGFVALDTETNNTLDYINCKLMGPCLYTPGLKQAYIPINHIDPATRERLPWQLTEEDFKEELQRAMESHVKFIFHNYKFDYSVIKTTTGVKVPVFWDTQEAHKMIDERNVGRKFVNRLKNMYAKYIDKNQKIYDIETLFTGMEYALVPPELFAIYASTDAFVTYKLFEYQQDVFSYDSMKNRLKVFTEIEIPLLSAVAEMEYRGIAIDFDFVERVKNKYNNKLEEINKKVDDEMLKINQLVAEWKKTPEAQTKINDKKSKGEMLDNPINFSSPTQVAILLYDILKFPEGIDPKSPRGTGGKVLDELAEKYNFPLGKVMSEQKEVNKLLSTFINAIPEFANTTDKKIHCNFNTQGAETGRFSSNSPNLQNIPSHSKDIRPMFCADEGKVLVLADYSGMEVRMASSVSNDPVMIQAYKDGKDLYALIGSMVYKTTYENCLEHYVEGTKIMFEGKEVVCGNEKTTTVKDSNREFTIKEFMLVDSPSGFVEATRLNKSDKIVTDEGIFEIKNITTNNGMTTIRI